jgi:hypothetical protein
MDSGKENPVGRGAGIRRFAAAACVLPVLAFGVAPAQADTGDIIARQNDPHTPADGWQAGTCTTDAPECSIDTPGQFFRQAAGHPPVGFTQFIIKEGPSTLLPEHVP